MTFLGPIKESREMGEYRVTSDTCVCGRFWTHKPIQKCWRRNVDPLHSDKLLGAPVLGTPHIFFQEPHQVLTVRSPEKNLSCLWQGEEWSNLWNEPWVSPREREKHFPRDCVGHRSWKVIGHFLPHLRRKRTKAGNASDGHNSRLPVTWASEERDMS